MKTLLTLITSLLLFPYTYGQSAMSTNEKIEEVYGASYSTENPEAFLFLKNTLQNRIELEYHSNVNPSKYAPISSLDLRNKYNPNIPVFATESFTPLSFNPLRYNINFTISDKDQFFWIDNTNYVLIIRRQ